MILTAEKLSAAIDKSIEVCNHEDRKVNVEMTSSHPYRFFLEHAAQEQLEEALHKGENLKPVVFALIRAAFHKGVEVGLEYEK